MDIPRDMTGNPPSGFDEIGQGGWIQEPPKSHRTVKVYLPKYPGTGKGDPPVIEVEANSEGTNLSIEVKVTGDIKDPNEYNAIMELLTDIV